MTITPNHMRSVLRIFRHPVVLRAANAEQQLGLIGIILGLGRWFMADCQKGAARRFKCFMANAFKPKVRLNPSPV